MSEKVVQTTLEPGTYQRLCALAEKEGKPLKTVVREAIEAFVQQPWPKWEDDPLSKLVGSLSGGPGNLATRKDWAGAHKHGRVR